MNSITLLVYGCVFLYAIYKFIKREIENHQSRAFGTVQAPEYSEIDFFNALVNKSFGNFTLTKAVAIFKDSELIPKEGYMVTQQKQENGREYEILGISVSAERLYFLFDDFISLLGDTCGIVIEDHYVEEGQHMDHIAHQKDTVVVRSILSGFEEVIVSDGFLGVAVYDESGRTEVQLSDHKMIYVFSVNTGPFKEIMAEYGIKEVPDIVFINQVPHFHLAAENNRDSLEALKDRLCIDQTVVQPGDSTEFAY